MRNWLRRKLGIRALEASYESQARFFGDLMADNIVATGRIKKLEAICKAHDELLPLRAARESTPTRLPNGFELTRQQFDLIAKMLVSQFSISVHELRDRADKAAVRMDALASSFADLSEEFALLKNQSHPKPALNKTSSPKAKSRRTRRAGGR